MKEFCPISLCTIAYKCISKILANRIKLLLPSIINMAQSAFVKGRSISDNILIAQELFRGYTRDTGVPKCSVKLDLHKAFDSLSWDFLVAALTKFNFPRAFISWVYSYISITMYSVKINGVRQGYFGGAKGVRQGDPMSPYLFTIAMNILLSILDAKPTVYKHHWKFKELAISHLLFVDDVLLFLMVIKLPSLI